MVDNIDLNMIVELEEKMKEINPNQILAMLILIIIATVSYIVFNCFRKNGKNEKVSKVSNIAKWIGISIITSFFIVAILELVINRVDISVTVNNIIVNVLLLADFVFISSTVCGIFCYRKYKEILPQWLKLVYIIGVILLIIFIGDTMNQLNLRMQKR